MSCQDNQFYNYGCPAMMNDGRFLSSYVSAQTREDSFRNAYGLSSCKYDNNDSRLFKQQNATKIMNAERKYITDNYYCWLPRRPIKMELPFYNPSNYSGPAMFPSKKTCKRTYTPKKK